MSYRIYADIVCPDSIETQSTLIVGDHGLIEAIEPGMSGRIDHDYEDCMIVPGFVDVHVHGGGGADFMDGTEDSVRTVLRTHAQFGTTTLLATTLTASRQDIDQALIAICKVMDLPGANEARLAGIHLEGPYICSAKRGAQPLAPIRPPDIEELAHWIDISEGAIKLITIAPDAASDGGREFIEFAKSQGIVVSIGHTNATYDQANAAIGYGATHATHLFNAMPPLHHREPGTVGAVLAFENVMVELIADGVHVHPAIAKIIVQAKGADKVILITDAISGAAMPDSTYKLGGQDVIVSNGTAKFHDGTLAGSVLTMNQAFDNIQHFANITAESAAKMSSLNAARQFGMDSWTGSIAPDKRADIAVLNTKTGNVVAAMRDGNWVYQA